MSLFEDNQFEYRDTFFVFTNRENRPSRQQVESCLADLGSRYEISEVKGDDNIFECLTIKSPYDYSAMDVAYTEGDEVTSQVKELIEEFRTVTLLGDDQQKLLRMANFDARFDVYHFEQITDAPEDNILDPGGLLMVMSKLVELCDGIGLDPQSQALI